MRLQVSRSVFIPPCRRISPAHLFRSAPQGSRRVISLPVQRRRIPTSCEMPLVDGSERIQPAARPVKASLPLSLMPARPSLCWPSPARRPVLCFGRASEDLVLDLDAHLRTDLVFCALSSAGSRLFDFGDRLARAVCAIPLCVRIKCQMHAHPSVSAYC